MFKLEPRPQQSKFWSIASPLLALAITVVLGMVLFVALGKDPVKGLQVYTLNSVKDKAKAEKQSRQAEFDRQRDEGEKRAALFGDPIFPVLHAPTA